MIVYLIRNTLNGKCYVGQTVCGFKKRWGLHCWHSQNNPSGLLHRAMQKYGAECFEHCVLATANTIQELNELEIYHIRAQGTLKPNGYNLTSGGEGNTGWHPSNETRCKIAASLKGRIRPQSIEERARRSEALRGKPLHSGMINTEERNRKRSISMTGKTLSAEHRAAIGAGNKGKIVSPETIAKMRKPKSEEHKAKLRKPKSEEHKAKIRAGVLKFLNNHA